MAVGPAPGTTLAEEDLRLLQAEHDGVPHARVVVFLGREYPVAGAGLTALLRYAGAQKKGASEQHQMASAHRVLQECLDPECWPAFQEAALAGKATGDQISGVLQQLLEIHAARPWRAAMRLLGYAAQNLAELDGTMLAETGRGMGDLTPRQLCNLVFARLIAGRDEEGRAEFIEDLYLDFDPDAEAMKRVQEMIASKEAAG